MKNVTVGLNTLSVGRLELAQLVSLAVAGVRRKILVNEKVPNLFPALSSIERFVLSITYPSELLVGYGRFCAIALPNELDDAFAVIDLLAQKLTQISAFGAEDFLPNGL